MKRLYYIEAKVTLEVVIHVSANDEQEAFAKANDRAWANVVPNWNKSKLTHIGEIKVGPKVN